MSLNNESCNSSDDESLRSSGSIIFSSGRSSSSPIWSRSSSMTSGISTITTTSSESRKKSKAKFGPISRPTPTELKLNQRVSKVQQQNSQENSSNLMQTKSKKKSLLPIQPKSFRPAANMLQPQGWLNYGRTFGPPVQRVPCTMMYYPPPSLQMQVAYKIPMPCSVPMPTPTAQPMYSQPQARYGSIQVQHTCIWTYTYVNYA